MKSRSQASNRDRRLPFVVTLAVATLVVSSQAQLTAEELQPKSTVPALQSSSAPSLLTPQIRQAENEVQLLAAELEVHKAGVARTGAQIKVARERLSALKSVTAAVPQSRTLETLAEVKILQAELQVKQAGQRVAQTRLQQARDRLERLRAQATKEAVAPRPGIRERQTLLEAKRKAAQRAFKLTLAGLQHGHGGSESEQAYLWSRRWMDAQRELSQKKADQWAAIELHLERMKQLEKHVKKLFEAREIAGNAVPATEHYRLEAQLWLLRDKEESSDLKKGEKK